MKRWQNCRPAPPGSWPNCTGSTPRHAATVFFFCEARSACCFGFPFSVSPREVAGCGREGGCRERMTTLGGYIIQERLAMLARQAGFTQSLLSLTNTIISCNSSPSSSVWTLVHFAAANAAAAPAATTGSVSTASSSGRCCLCNTSSSSKLRPLAPLLYQITLTGFLSEHSITHAGT